MHLVSSYNTHCIFSIRTFTPSTSSSSRFAAFFFFNDTATTEIYTLSLHDALPIYPWVRGDGVGYYAFARAPKRSSLRDRKSTRLNSSHQIISYAVFCLKKKKKPISSTLLCHTKHSFAKNMNDKRMITTHV